MGSPYFVEFQTDLRNRKMFQVTQDTLSDVLTNGPALSTFERLTKNSYYTEGLYTPDNGRHYQPQGIFAGDMLSLLEEATLDEFLKQNSSPVSLGTTNGYQPEGNSQTGSPSSCDGTPSDRSPCSTSDDSDIFNYPVIDLSDIVDSACTEVKECSLLDIIDADMEEEILANDIDTENTWTLPKDSNADIDSGEFHVENSVMTLSMCDPAKNEYFRNDKDTDKEARRPRNQKGKSSMARTDALAILLRCRVCGGRASGYHYGAETCGACKIFFARYNQKSPPHTCIDRVTGRVLKYNSITARPCPGCRLQKCFQVGMDIKASKKGRYSYKRKYDYIRRTKNESALPVIPAFPGDVIDDIILMASHISDLFLSCKTYKPDFFQKLKEIETQYLENILFDAQKYGIGTILEDKDKSAAKYGPDTGKHQIYLRRFNSLDRRIKTYISFARKIPGFNYLPKEDQISIFKGAAIFLAKISEYRAYNVLRGLEILPEGHVVSKETIAEFFSEDYVDLLFSIADKFQKLNLNENERNLLKCVAFFSSEFCCSSQGKVIAEKHQDQMIKAFQHLIRKNRENNSLENYAKVIGNAVNVLAELHVFKSKADKSFVDINKKYPTLMPGLIMEVTDPLAVQ